MSTVFKLGNEEFEQIPTTAIAASKWLTDIYIKLGRPDDPLSEKGEHMMNAIVNVWEFLDPKSAKQRRASIQEYRDTELDVKEQVKQGTGRNVASLPTPVYHLMGKFFPQFKLDNRDNFMRLTKRYPYFRVTGHL